MKCSDHASLDADAAAIAEYENRHRPGPNLAGECEELMWQFQRPLPLAKVGEKWVPMERIFSLRGTLGEEER